MLAVMLIWPSMILSSIGLAAGIAVLVLELIRSKKAAPVMGI